MIADLIKDGEARMGKAVEATRHELTSIRTGRANPALLDKVLVDYFGTPMPINQLANITVPEPRSLVIQPWDKSSIAHIERALMKSDLGLTPNSDGNVIRLNIPQLNEERRKEMIKLAHKKTEDGRVAIRNIRRDVNDHIQKTEKSHEVSEDESKRGQEQVQKLTDKYIAQVDELQKHKEAELMEV